MSVIALIAMAAIAADDPQGVVATAPQGDNFVPQAAPAGTEAPDAEPVPHGMTTEEQIDAYLAAGREAERQQHDQDRYANLDVLPSYDRRTYIDAGYAFGSHGYQAYHATVVAPLGDNVTVGLSYSKSEGGIPSGYYGYAPGYDYGRRPWVGGRPPSVQPQATSAESMTTVGASLKIDWSDDAPRRGVRQR